MQVLRAQEGGHLDKFESRSLDGVLLGYSSSSRAFRVWVLESRQVVETCEVSFDESVPCTTPIIELSGDDEVGTSIFKDDEDVNGAGDAGAPAPAAAPAPSATSSDDDGGLVPSTSTMLFQAQARAEDGPAGEVTSERQPSRRV